MADDNKSSENFSPKRRLTVFDAVSLIVGCIIGSGIFVLPPLVAGNVPNGTIMILAWIFGGFIAANGALCFAELASTYPRSGGDYVYLSKAYNRLTGFMFVWFELLVVRTGNIAFMALTLAIYANKLYPTGEIKIAFGETTLDFSFAPFAVGAIVVLTITNLIGVRAGKTTQNVLSTIKVVCLVAIALVAFFFPRNHDLPTQQKTVQSTASVESSQEETTSQETQSKQASSGQASNETTATPALWTTLSAFGLAMVFVMFTFGGWNDVAFVSGEIINPGKNLLRSLLLGVAVVTAIYVIINLAYLYGLGFEGLKNSEAVASDLLYIHLGDFGGRAISALVCVSCLGAINSMVFTGARIYHAMGQEHSLFQRAFGNWNEKLGGPASAIVVQSIVSVVLILIFGSLDNGLTRLLDVTAIIFFSFFFLVSVSVLLLRRKEPDVERPFRIPLFPIPLIIFMVSCLYMLQSSIRYVISQKHWFECGLLSAILAIGVFVYFMSNRTGSESVTKDE